jgi:hypothetical protein
MIYNKEETMEIGEQDNKEPKYPKYRTQEGYLEDWGTHLFVYEKTPDPVAKILYKEIKSIDIKPAGTLYNGQVTITFTNNASVKYGINAYQQKDFEEFKVKTGK